MTDTQNLEDWITTTEAARLTGYASSSFRHFILRGKLPARKLGRDWVLLRSDVEAYKAKMDLLGPDKHNPNSEKTKKKLEA